MNQHSESPENLREIPKAIVKKTRRVYWLVWLVPVFAAALAGYYLYDRLQHRGQEITIYFNDATGLKAGESFASHRGVEIGKVSSVRLADDKKKVVVEVQLHRSQIAFAKTGAIFWTVRPEISMESITGLNTILAGPYIEAIPGTGEVANEFTGLDKPPTHLGTGLRIVLHAPRLEHLQADAPVYFRGIEVGTIQDIQLSPDASGIDVHLFIQHRYSTLVRTASQFWVVKGADIKGGLIGGVHLKLGSLQSIITGGVTFATPEKMGDIAGDGAEYPLFDEPKKEWLDWSPRIALRRTSPRMD